MVIRKLTFDKLFFPEELFLLDRAISSKIKKLSDQAMACRARVRHLSSGGKCLRARVRVARRDEDGKENGRLETSAYFHCTHDVIV